MASRLLIVAWIVMLTAAFAAIAVTRSPGEEGPRRAKPLNPADWGEDHVGRPLPEFIESGECLFCHRREVGTSWSENRHQRTIRDARAKDPAVKALRKNQATASLAEAVELILGDRRAIRFLKRSADYGKLDMLTAVATSRRGRRFKIEHGKSPHWDAERFARRCAGCHATAVDPVNKTFSLPSLDCFTCHGDAPLEHSNDTSLMPLAKDHHDSPRVITSICGQCHLRGGKSKSTGRPYATNFVAGDNLFRDFQIDLTAADDARINPGDRHVLEYTREVVLNGRQDMTCLTCHDIHGQSTRRHRDLKDEASCSLCHEPGKPKRDFIRYEAHSSVCEY